MYERLRARGVVFRGEPKPDEWAVLMYKHTDHHLRQFGV
jgi:hypothetical protein